MSCTTGRSRLRARSSCSRTSSASGFGFSRQRLAASRRSAAETVTKGDHLLSLLRRVQIVRVSVSSTNSRQFRVRAQRSSLPSGLFIGRVGGVVEYSGQVPAARSTFSSRGFIARLRSPGFPSHAVSASAVEVFRVRYGPVPQEGGRAPRVLFQVCELRQRCPMVRQESFVFPHLLSKSFGSGMAPCRRKAAGHHVSSSRYANSASGAQWSGRNRSSSCVHPGIPCSSTITEVFYHRRQHRVPVGLAEPRPRLRQDSPLPRSGASEEEPRHVAHDRSVHFARVRPRHVFHAFGELDGLPVRAVHWSLPVSAAAVAIVTRLMGFGSAFSVFRIPGRAAYGECTPFRPVGVTPGRHARGSDDTGVAAVRPVRRGPDGEGRGDGLPAVRSRRSADTDWSGGQWRETGPGEATEHGAARASCVGPPK